LICCCLKTWSRGKCRLGQKNLSNKRGLIKSTQLLAGKPHQRYNNSPGQSVNNEERIKEAGKIRLLSEEVLYYIPNRRTHVKAEKNKGGGEKKGKDESLIKDKGGRKEFL